VAPISGSGLAVFGRVFAPVPPLPVDDVLVVDAPAPDAAEGDVLVERDVDAAGAEVLAGAAPGAAGWIVA
jgi:hypothetical protein